MIKKQEIRMYYAEHHISEIADHLEYWWIKSSTYPTLALLARKYLAVPVSSVYSERFSEYGNLYEKKRSRIRPAIAEKVLFLHHNWRRAENNGRKPADDRVGASYKEDGTLIDIGNDDDDDDEELRNLFDSTNPCDDFIDTEDEDNE